MTNANIRMNTNNTNNCKYAVIHIRIISIHSYISIIIGSKGTYYSIIYFKKITG